MSRLSPEELDSLARKNPLAFGINHIDLLDGKEWSLNDRKWMIEPYLALNPYEIEKGPLGKARKLAITKSTQAGISTMAITKALHFMAYWDVRVGMMLPRQKDISDFSATRLEPIIANSARLTELKGQPDSVYTKRIGNSYLFFLEGSVEPRSMPMDALFLDEVDLCNPDHVGTAINRLDASPWHLLTYLSTPTLPGVGIDAVFETSDQREWIVACPHCGYKQVMDWDANLRLRGPESNPDVVWYGCAKCSEEITVQDMQAGEWVARMPSRSSDCVGYHISQMFIKPAPELYRHFRDPNQTRTEFYRKRLGRPFTVAGGAIEREDIIINCFNDPYEPESTYDGRSTYVMGVDQGNQLQAIVAKLEPGKALPKIAHIEIVPFEQGFDRVAMLMRLYNVKRAIVDGDPNRHSVKKLQQDFPGRVLMGDYIETQRERYVIKKDKITKLPALAHINRTEGFDDLMATIKSGGIQLPGSPSRPLPEVETYIDHLTAIRRDLEKRNTPSGEVEVAVWRKLRAEHLAHASLYMLIAAQSLSKSGSFRSRTVGAVDIVAVEDNNVPVVDAAVHITSLLAEVPIEQLKEYVSRNSEEGYVVPFPLSHKLRLCLDEHTHDTVLFVMRSITAFS